MAFSKVTSNEELNNARRNKKTVQGASKFTERKTKEIEGIASMRFNYLKGSGPSAYYDQILVADVFSGSGENVLDADSAPIDGSPIKLLNALHNAAMPSNKMNLMGLKRKKVSFYFSDIRSQAIADLDRVIADNWKPIEGLQTRIITKASSATDSISQIHSYLREERRSRTRTHVILVLDPNGPKAFPRDEVLGLLDEFSRCVDVIPYISATAVNRCIKHRDTSDVKYDWWLNSIERFDSGFVYALANKRDGWIRTPLKNDPQHWLMMPTFTPLAVPRNDWAKQGYVRINSQEGRQAIAIYSGESEAA
jgi:three-Cys-motif partner protein